MIKDMYDKIEEGFDIVCCDTLECYCDHKRNRIISWGLEKDIIKLNENNGFLPFFPTAWNKIYKNLYLLIMICFIRKKYGLRMWKCCIECCLHKFYRSCKKPYYFIIKELAISKSFDERISLH